MAKDYYSGSPRKTSGTRRGTRDRIASPTERRLPPSPAPFPVDADDALSGILVQRDVIGPNRPRALSTIRQHIQDNMGTIFTKVKRAGETDLDAGNAIRARLGQRLVPRSFTVKEPAKGRGFFGTLEPGSQVTVARVKVTNKRLVYTVSGRTPGGRPIQADIPGSEIGRMF